ncbi:hypothetical protein [Schlesneria sp. DSM 10557]|uniref:hypothetical protein n=1 Tax=Schlesneria sp. DSM 10557 TaxID=3044399 RepID=UPI00359F5064
MLAQLSQARFWQFLQMGGHAGKMDLEGCANWDIGLREWSEVFRNCLSSLSKIGMQNRKNSKSEVKPG